MRYYLILISTLVLMIPSAQAWGPMMMSGGVGVSLTSEDLSTYTEVDPGTYLSVISSRVTFTSLDRNIDAYIYKDLSGEFDGNFEVRFSFRTTSLGIGGGIVGLVITNDLNDILGLRTGDKNHIEAVFYDENSPATNDEKFYLQETDGAADYSDISTDLDPQNTTYYCKLIRDEDVGTYGTIYLYIYSDASYSTLVDTCEVALHTSKKDYTYLMLAVSFDSDASNYVSGYWEYIYVNP